MSTYVEIAVASMDLYPYALPGTPSWASNVEQFVPFLEQTHAHDVEIHPTNAVVADVQQRTQCGDTELVGEVIGSQHMAFNNGQGIIGKVMDARGVMHPAGSIDGMAIIQNALPYDAQAVMFPDHAPKGGYTDENTGIKQRIAQPSAGVYRDLQKKYPHLDVYSNEGLLAAFKGEGIIGFCPDTAQARGNAADGHTTPYVEEVWGSQFASGSVYEMHAAMGRADLAARDPQFAEISMQELAAFASPDWRRALKTQMGQMIVEGVKMWVPPADIARPILRAVVEVPPLPKLVLRSKKMHANIVANIAEIVRHAGGHPLLWGSPEPTFQPNV